MKSEKEIQSAVDATRTLAEAASSLGVPLGTFGCWCAKLGIRGKDSRGRKPKLFDELKEGLEEAIVIEGGLVPFDVSKGDPRVVGVIPDTHFPFANWDVIHWIYQIFKDNNVGKIIHVGDIQDQCVWSRFGKDGDFDSPASEWQKSKADMERLHRLFPEVTVLFGNHDTRISAKAMEVGIPRDLMRNFNEVFNFPKWEFVVDTVLPYIYDNVAYAHGDNLNMTVNISLMAEKLGMSVMAGHNHKLKLAWSESSIRQVWGATAGCAVDTSTYGMRYAKKCANKVNLGCAVVKHGNPFLFAYPK